MKESNNDENDKSINKFQIFSKSFGVLKYYTINSFKSLSNRIYSFSFLSSNQKNKTQSNNLNDLENKFEEPNEKKENNYVNKNNLEINKENELLIYNNSQIKKNLYIYLESELKINNTKIELKNSNSNKLTQINKYKEFKNKTIIYFFSSIIFQKYYNIISITSLCIISIMKNLNTYSNKNEIKLILDTLWNLTNQTSKFIFSTVSEIISNYIDKILLNEKYTKNNLDELITNIQRELREKCNFFVHIIKEIKKEIYNIEGQFYDINNVKDNMILEYKLRFLYIFCDLIFSDMFYSSFVETYENEILTHIEEIKQNYGDKNEKTFLAIIFDIDAFRNKQLVDNEENNIINNININNKNINEDNILRNYQKCLQSIFN